MSAAFKHPPARMTVAEFLQWDSGDRSGACWQLVDGEPVAMAPAHPIHGAIQSEISYLLRAHMIATDRSCVVVTAPGVIPRARAEDNLRIPDLAVTCSPDLAGPALTEPVLLIEVLSPSNVAETRANVWSYTTLPSVLEIVVVHTARREAEVLRRIDGDWPANPEVVSPDGVLRLDSIGFAAPLADLYRTSGVL